MHTHTLTLELHCRMKFHKQAMWTRIKWTMLSLSLSSHVKVIDNTQLLHFPFASCTRMSIFSGSRQRTEWEASWQSQKNLSFFKSSVVVWVWVRYIVNYVLDENVILEIMEEWSNERTKRAGRREKNIDKCKNELFFSKFHWKMYILIAMYYHVILTIIIIIISWILENGIRHQSLKSNAFIIVKRNKWTTKYQNIEVHRIIDYNGIVFNESFLLVTLKCVAWITNKCFIW